MKRPNHHAPTNHQPRFKVRIPTPRPLRCLELGLRLSNAHSRVLTFFTTSYALTAPGLAALRVLRGWQAAPP